MKSTSLEKNMKKEQTKNQTITVKYVNYKYLRLCINIEFKNSDLLVKLNCKLVKPQHQNKKYSKTKPLHPRNINGNTGYKINKDGTTKSRKQNQQNQ